MAKGFFVGFKGEASIDSQNHQKLSLTTQESSKLTKRGIITNFDSQGCGCEVGGWGGRRGLRGGGTVEKIS